MLKQMDPLVLGFVLPLIPSALIGARFINWQLYGLQAWRKYWPVLKGWMGYESSEGNRRRSEPQRKPAQVNKPGADAVSMSRIVIGALALPSCAALLGYTMYGNLVESYTKRSLLVSQCIDNYLELFSICFSDWLCASSGQMIQI